MKFRTMVLPDPLFVLEEEARVPIMGKVGAEGGEIDGQRLVQCNS